MWESTYQDGLDVKYYAEKIIEDMCFNDYPVINKVFEDLSNDITTFIDYLEPYYSFLYFTTLIYLILFLLFLMFFIQSILKSQSSGNSEIKLLEFVEEKEFYDEKEEDNKGQDKRLPV